MNEALAHQAKEILAYHKSVRHLRGGEGQNANGKIKCIHQRCKH